MKLEQIVHVGTSKVRLIEGRNRLDRVQSCSDHTNKQTDYKRGDEGCFKGQHVEFMTYRNKVFSLQHYC